MKITIHRAQSRGTSSLDWLHSRHTYSFSSYQDPERMGFGALRVINDDVVQPGRGFKTHSHENMEIISIPLSGSLQHEDSMQHQHVITAGEVQIMSAGTGIAHSEFNPSATEPVSFLQIWVLPKQLNIEPRYEQKRFDLKKNQLQFIVSPDGRQDSLAINQDAYFSLVELDAACPLNYALQREGNGVYLFVISGSVKVGDVVLNARDGAEITQASDLELHMQQAAKLLLIEVPLQC